LGSLVHIGPGRLRLVNNPLILRGNLINVAGRFDARDQSVVVDGRTSILGGVYDAGQGGHNLTGGLTVETTFRGDLCVVNTDDVVLGVGSLLVGLSSLSVAGDWFNAGGTFDAASGEVVFTGSGPQRLSGAGQVFHTLIHQGAGLLTVTDDLTLTGAFRNEDGAGSVDLTRHTLFVGGDWSWGTTGKLKSRGSTVVFTGPDQRISGNTTFGNLTRVATTAGTLTFEAGSTQTVTGTLTLTGVPGGLLTLASSDAGRRWNLKPARRVVASFVDVQDSRNRGRRPITARDSVNAGRNIGWNFR
jgi:hypothetical protein